MVATLLKAGANVNQIVTRPEGERTPLMESVMAGHNDVVQLLLEHDADPMHAAPDGCTALITAAFNGQLNVIKTLFKHGCSPEQRWKGNGASPLHIAATLGHANAVGGLLEGNAEVDAIRTDGCTALLLAAQKGHSTVVAVLLAARADPDHMLVGGVTPLHVAAHGGHVDTARLLLRAGVSPRSEKLAMARLTVLMSAASHNAVTICKLLSASGADLTATSTDGRTAAGYAKDAGHAELAAWLAKMSQFKPLQIALMCRLQDDYKVALQFGWCDPDDCESMGAVCTAAAAAYDADAAACVGTSSTAVAAATGTYADAASVPATTAGLNVQQWRKRELSTALKFGRMCMSGWRRRSHRLYPKPYRQIVATVLLVCQRHVVNSANTAAAVAAVAHFQTAGAAGGGGGGGGGGSSG